MINYLDSYFVDDIVRRVNGWRLSYDKKNTNIKRNLLGMFATVSTNAAHCRNTGIYEPGDLRGLAFKWEVLIVYPGFNWTEETIRQHTLDKLKGLQLEVKEKSIVEDFK